MALNHLFLISVQILMLMFELRRWVQYLVCILIFCSSDLLFPEFGMVLTYFCFGDNLTALIRHNKPGITAFRLANGYAALRDALTSENVRFQR